MMDYPTPEQSVTSAIRDCVITIQELLEKQRQFPALILLYSMTDILGSLLRPKAQVDTTSTDFKRWVDRYLIPPGCNLAVTADDLWAARCGLLHTDTPDSRHSREGKAKQIHYVRGNKEAAKFVNQEIQTTDPSRAVVDVDVLFDAFLGAVMRFTQDIQGDASIREVVFHHAKKMFSHYGFRVA